MGEHAFTPGRDHPDGGGLPIRSCMGSAVESTPPRTAARNLQLLRPPAKVRLEEALGAELAQKLLKSLGAERC